MRRSAGSATLAVLVLVMCTTPSFSQHAAGDHASPASEATIGFDAVRPQRLDVVTGATVRWTNESARVHTVTADDASFDSGRIAISQMFSHAFPAAGAVPYHCVLHPFIRGVVAVSDVLLDAPSAAASPDRPFPLSGRSALPADTPISIEADAGAGAGFVAVATTMVAADRTFAARVQPAVSASYRAVGGGATSPAVTLLVLDQRISLHVRRDHGRVLLDAAVTPPSRGAHVVLQLLLPERFGWWPVRRAVLGKRSTARFELRPHRRLQARIVLTLADGATRLALSRTVRIGRRH